MEHLHQNRYKLFHKHVIHLELQSLSHLEKIPIVQKYFLKIKSLPVVDIFSRPINIVEFAADGARSLYTCKSSKAF
jgi:hypothetical protein